MKFPCGDNHDKPSGEDGTPDVTFDVLGRLGVPNPDRGSSCFDRCVLARMLRRVRFVALLGGIIVTTVVWRTLSASDDGIDLVESVPRAIEEGRQSRAQLLMGFMAPFEQIGQSIVEVGGVDGLPDMPREGVFEGGALDLYGSSPEVDGRPTPDDILEASAPFPSS